MPPCCVVHDPKRVHCVSETTEAIGTTRIYFELHTYHGGYWMCAKVTDDQEEAEAGARHAQADKVGFGVRVARCTEYEDYGHVSRSFRWWLAVAAEQPTRELSGLVLRCGRVRALSGHMVRFRFAARVHADQMGHLLEQ